MTHGVSLQVWFSTFQCYHMRRALHRSILSASECHQHMSCASIFRGKHPSKKPFSCCTHASSEFSRPPQNTYNAWQEPLHVRMPFPTQTHSRTTRDRSQSPQPHPTHEKKDRPSKD